MKKISLMSAIALSALLLGMNAQAALAAGGICKQLSGQALQQRIAAGKCDNDAPEIAPAPTYSETTAVPPVKKNPKLADIIENVAPKGSNGNKLPEEILGSAPAGPTDGDQPLDEILKNVAPNGSADEMPKKAKAGDELLLTESDDSDSGFSGALKRFFTAKPNNHDDAFDRQHHDNDARGAKKDSGGKGGAGGSGSGGGSAHH